MTDMFGPQPAKTPKTATKLKLTTPKAPGTGEKKAKDSTKTSKPKSERKKSKAAASDEDAAEEEVKEPEKELDPAEAKAKKEKEGKCPAVWYGKVAHYPQFSSSDTNSRKAFCLAIKHLRKVRWPLCPISSQSSRTTATSK
jgi:hypothetical protein